MEDFLDGVKFVSAVVGSLLLATLIVIGIGVTPSLIGYDRTYSDGARIGIITRYSETGFFWKTWEGEMVLSGLKRGGKGSETANLWRFSVRDPDAAKKVLAAFENGEPVKLRYIQVWLRCFKVGSTDYDVQSVEKME